MRRMKTCEIAAGVLVLFGSVASAGMLNQVPCPDCGATVSTRTFRWIKCERD